MTHELHFYFVVVFTVQGCFARNDVSMQVICNIKEHKITSRLNDECRRYDAMRQNANDDR